MSRFVNDPRPDPEEAPLLEVTCSTRVTRNLHGATKDSVKRGTLSRRRSHHAHDARRDIQDGHFLRSSARITRDGHERDDEHDDHESRTTPTGRSSSEHPNEQTQTRASGERDLRATVRIRSAHARRALSRATRAGILDPDILEHSASP